MEDPTAGGVQESIEGIVRKDRPARRMVHETAVRVVADRRVAVDLVATAVMAGVRRRAMTVQDVKVVVVGMVLVASQAAGDKMTVREVVARKVTGGEVIRLISVGLGVATIDAVLAAMIVLVRARQDATRMVGALIVVSGRPAMIVVLTVAAMTRPGATRTAAASLTAVIVPKVAGLTVVVKMARPDAIPATVAATMGGVTAALVAGGHEAVLVVSDVHAMTRDALTTVRAVIGVAMNRPAVTPATDVPLVVGGTKMTVAAMIVSARAGTALARLIGVGTDRLGAIRTIGDLIVADSLGVRTVQPAMIEVFSGATMIAGGRLATRRAVVIVARIVVVFSAMIVVFSHVMTVAGVRLATRRAVVTVAGIAGVLSAMIVHAVVVMVLVVRLGVIRMSDVPAMGDVRKGIVGLSSVPIGMIGGVVSGVSSRIVPMTCRMSVQLTPSLMTMKSVNCLLVCGRRLRGCRQK